MWCHNCDQPSYAKKTTVRLTNDGAEIIIQICGLCNRKSETEFYKGSTVRITDKPPKQITKKRLRKNITIKVKNKNGRRIKKYSKKTSLGNKLR